MGDAIRILRWLVGDGQHVVAGDPICEIESDKANVTIDAWIAGKVVILAKPEDTVDIRSEFFRIVIE